LLNSKYKLRIGIFTCSHRQTNEYDKEATLPAGGQKIGCPEGKSRVIVLRPARNHANVWGGELFLTMGRGSPEVALLCCARANLFFVALGGYVV
jgi:hypothetical protein